MEQEEAERNMQILLDFLHCLRKQKVDELKEVQTDLQFIKEDIGAVEKHRMDLYRARDRYSVKLRMLDDFGGRKSLHSSMDKNSSGLASSPLNLRGGLSSGSHTKKNDGKSQISSHGIGIQRRDAISGSDSQYVNQSGLALVRKKRVHTQVILV
ncbi:E3 ubiquitin-protein ligase COP1-like [Trifolium medium]|uniref:E3 ubiquitin-protein ligase COP1-like n=1 Tax=Trifolium medium TaxID=97028 RepID=A0A392MDR1_9FABA|nr:E3 ubiquitin-protein ligase COP1-like [Trifolium medium]